MWCDDLGWCCGVVVWWSVDELVWLSRFGGVALVEWGWWSVVAVESVVVFVRAALDEVTWRVLFTAAALSSQSALVVKLCF